MPTLPRKPQRPKLPDIVADEKAAMERRKAIFQGWLADCDEWVKNG